MDLKGTPYWSIYTETFQFFKKALPVQRSQAYWDGILKSGNAITEKYVNTPFYEFAMAQVSAIISELERVSSAEKEKKIDIHIARKST